MVLPSFDASHFNYDGEKGLTYFAQWDGNGSMIDEASVTLSNVSYETISESDLKNLNSQLVPNAPKYKFFNTNARGKRAYYFEISPIISDRGVFKKITSFTVNYNSSSGRTQNASRNEVTNSVLSNGEWYKFYIEESGVFQLTKGFLNSLGVNTNSVDPRSIKIYGNGGRMLPLLKR